MVANIFWKDSCISKQQSLRNEVFFIFSKTFMGLSSGKNCDYENGQSLFYSRSTEGEGPWGCQGSK